MELTDLLYLEYASLFLSMHFLRHWWKKSLIQSQVYHICTYSWRAMQRLQFRVPRQIKGLLKKSITNFIAFARKHIRVFKSNGCKATILLDSRCSRSFVTRLSRVAIANFYPPLSELHSLLCFLTFLIGLFSSTLCTPTPENISQRCLCFLHWE